MRTDRAMTGVGGGGARIAIGKQIQRAHIARVTLRVPGSRHANGLNRSFITEVQQGITGLLRHYPVNKDIVLKYMQVTGGGLCPTFIRDPFEYPRRQRGR